MSARVKEAGAPESTAPASTEPDAELIALVAKAEEADDHSNAIWDTIDDLLPDDPRWNVGIDESIRALEPFKQIVKLVTGMHPRTVEGLRAKASLALRSLCSEDKEDNPLVVSLLQNVMESVG